MSFYSSAIVFGQIKSFGTKAKRKPEPNYLLSIYGYYDIVREYGVGAQFQLNPLLSIDGSCYRIYPYGYMYQKILQEDYYDFQGLGFSLKPKYHFSTLGRFYVGLNFSYEWLHHDIVSVEYPYYYYHNLHHYQEDAKGTAYTLGVTFGNKIKIRQLFIEPFLGIGITNSKLKKNVYGVDHVESFDKPFPYTETIRLSFFQINIGLKIGFSCIKNKKHMTIDKKFDEVYLPKVNSLKSYFETINFNDKAIEKDLRRAYGRYEALNRNALTKYKLHYHNSTAFYNKMDFLLHRIDSLIINSKK